MTAHVNRLRGRVMQELEVEDRQVLAGVGPPCLYGNMSKQVHLRERRLQTGVCCLRADHQAGCPYHQTCVMCWLGGCMLWGWSSLKVCLVTFGAAFGLAGVRCLQPSTELQAGSWHAPIDVDTNTSVRPVLVMQSLPLGGATGWRADGWDVTTTSCRLMACCHSGGAAG